MDASDPTPQFIITVSGGGGPPTPDERAATEAVALAAVLERILDTIARDERAARSPHRFRAEAG